MRLSDDFDTSKATQFIGGGIEKNIVSHSWRNVLQKANPREEYA
jgi:hypothetical protein